MSDISSARQRQSETQVEAELGIEPASPATARLTSLIVAGLGGLAIAAALTFVVSGGSATQGVANQPTLSQVSVSEIDDAIKTMTPKAGEAAAEQAKSCKAPIASAVLTNAPGAAARVVQLRSGNYVSPPFTLTDTPQRIAFPYPAPFEVGKGVISVEGAAKGTTVTLVPMATVDSPLPSFNINVWWTPQKSC